MWGTIGTSGTSFGGISYSIESTAFTDGVPPSRARYLRQHDAVRIMDKGKFLLPDRQNIPSIGEKGIGTYGKFYVMPPEGVPR